MGSSHGEIDFHGLMEQHERSNTQRSQRWTLG
jgi:hypothetical protein